MSATIDRSTSAAAGSPPVRPSRATAPENGLFCDLLDASHQAGNEAASVVAGGATAVVAGGATALVAGGATALFAGGATVVVAGGATVMASGGATVVSGGSAGGLPTPQAFAGAIAIVSAGSGGSAGAAGLVASADPSTLGLPDGRTLSPARIAHYQLQNQMQAQRQAGGVIPIGRAVDAGAASAAMSGAPSVSGDPSPPAPDGGVMSGGTAIATSGGATVSSGMMAVSGAMPMSGGQTQPASAPALSNAPPSSSVGAGPMPVTSGGTTAQAVPDTRAMPAPPVISGAKPASPGDTVTSGRKAAKKTADAVGGTDDPVVSAGGPAVAQATAFSIAPPITPAADHTAATAPNAAPDAAPDAVAAPAGGVPKLDGSGAGAIAPPSGTTGTDPSPAIADAAQLAGPLQDQAAPPAGRTDAPPATGDFASLVGPAPQAAVTAAPGPMPAALPSPLAGHVVRDATAQISIRLTAAMRGGERSLTMELRPEALGRVAVKLDFRDGGVVGVQMTMDREDTYQSFRQDQRSIERQLAQSGLDLGGGLDLRFGQNGQQPEPGRDAPAARMAARIDDAGTEAGSERDGAAPPRIPAASLIDISA